MRANYIEDLSSWEKGFTFYSEVNIRFSETDMYGHLNNTVTFAYFEYARIEYFKHIKLMNDWLNPKGEKIPVVADLQCDYLKQVFFDEKLRIYVKSNSIGSSSVDLHYMAKNENEEIVFTGRGTIVQIDKKTGKGSKWSEKEKEVFRKYA
ncbi:acyl-CoA thioesterase [Psychrobacillus vulpis]|uniref:Acyl-CoA thioesterase n=1 Tax=Psychrobacillus vulpis TaxID=2325572 RepID=A0A544TR01_9BACI|nr:thioesterase family protein [Psychrobacillus vulpis]TQR19879.1 acyl-CoA thioesterase [Psychrobacillus vulpis]